MNLSADEQDFDMAAVLRDLWAARLYLALCCALSVLGVFVFLHAARPYYQASIMVAPAQNIESVAYNSGVFPEGLPVYAANQTPQDQIQPYFTRFEAMYAGPSVAALLLRDQRVRDGLADDYAFSSDGEAEWNAAQLSAYMRGQVWLDPFGETALRALQYRHPDPQFAAYFLQQIHRTADQLIRKDIRTGVDERIDYLERAIGKTPNPDHRRAITGLLLEQERVRMMVSMDEPVAAKVIEKAYAAPRPVWPDPYLFYGGFLLLGLLIGYVVFNGVAAFQNRVDVLGDEAAQRQDRKMPLSYSRWFDAGAGNENAAQKPGPFQAAKSHPSISDDDDVSDKSA